MANSCLLCVLSLANVYYYRADLSLANMTYEMGDLYFKTLW